MIVKPRNLVAKDLLTPKYRKRVEATKKERIDKNIKKHKNRPNKY